MSKTIIWILPQILTLGGEIQKILLLFNLVMANATPTDMVAGKAGGTVIVIRSRDLSITYSVDDPSLSSSGTVTAKPPIPTRAMIPTNIKESW